MTIQQIRLRNWHKARLKGFCLDTSILTEAEKELYLKARELLHHLESNWDSQTEILIGHPLPLYKCSWCGKRSKRECIYEGTNYCPKHYKELINEARLESISGEAGDMG